jgi:hypothetical protein
MSQLLPPLSTVPREDDTRPAIRRCILGMIRISSAKAGLRPGVRTRLTGGLAGCRPRGVRFLAGLGQ